MSGGMSICDQQFLMEIQADAIADWIDACVLAEASGDEAPYPVFLTVDEYIDAVEGSLEYH